MRHYIALGYTYYLSKNTFLNQEKYTTLDRISDEIFLIPLKPKPFWICENVEMDILTLIMGCKPE